MLPPLIIFKGTQISSNWVSPTILHDWRFSTSSKGWTSNVHGLEWLRCVFEPATREKVQGRQRLLICDGHDSHISGNFIAHYMRYKITLLLLPPHSSHYTQPLDVAVFGPLSTFLGQAVDRFASLRVARISKAEWLELYVKAHQRAITVQNIASGWRGAGLIPLSRKKVLRHLPIPILRPVTLPRPEAILQAITSSPPDFTVLRAANIAFNASITSGNPLDTPVRK